MSERKLLQQQQHDRLKTNISQTLLLGYSSHNLVSQVYHAETILLKFLFARLYM